MEHQRARLLSAVTELLCENGYERATVSAICERAGVSKNVFYEIFSDKEDCFVQGFEKALTRVRGQIEQACTAELTWSQQVCAAVGALLDALSTEPSVARFLLVEAFGVGDVIHDRYQQALEALALHLSRAAPEVRHPRPSDVLLAEAVCGGVASLLRHEILAGRKDLRPLRRELGEFVLTPYFGRTEAKRIASA